MIKIPFSPPDITEAEISEVVEALNSGWITTGPKTKELEKLVAQRCGTAMAACLNSNTACTEMTLRILGIGPGDEVIVPAYTYTATASVAFHVGAKVVMIDCEPGKFTIDYNKLYNAITPNTKAIIPVDLFGIPADYDTLFNIVEEKKAIFKPGDNKIQRALGRVAIVADAAHSFGATYKNKPIGSVADFTSFSFHAVKNLTTAEGGAVTFKNINGIDPKEIYNQYMLLSLHGQSKDAFAKNKPGAWEYDIKGPYYKCNMTDVHAGIGLGQIKRYNNILARRKEIILKMDEAFLNLPVTVLNHYTNNYTSSGHLYVMRLNNYTQNMRNDFIEKMANLGVSTNVHYKPLPMHTGYINLGYSIENYINAYNQYQNEVTLPLHTKLTDDDVNYIIASVKKCLN